MSAFFHEHIFIKKKAKNRITPWHHDQAYYPLNGMKVNIALPISITLTHSLKRLMHKEYIAER